MTDDLVAFLNARLTDDELEQRTEEGLDALDAWHAPDCASLPDGDRTTFACDCGVPARVLADIAAKRAIVGAYASAEEVLDGWAYPDDSNIGRADGLEEAARLLALPFAEHPDYRPEWAPGS